VFEDQLLCADLVILNKADLLDAPALAETRRAIEQRLRPAVRALTAVEGSVPPEVLLGLAAAAETDLASRPSHHDNEASHDHDDFESFVVERGAVADGAGFAARLAGVIAAHDVLRVKGFLDVPGKPLRQVVQAVGARVQRYFDRPWQSDEERQSRLVVIGKKGLDRLAIAAALQA
jgi:cobalamin biosynthesis protein CobW